MTTVYYDGFWPTYYEVRFLDYLGTGLWCGGFFVISGAVGLLAGCNPTDGRLEFYFYITAIEILNWIFYRGGGGRAV